MAKIYNEVIIDMNPESPTFEKTIHEDSYEYNGDMMLAQKGIYMGGERNIGFGKKQIRDLVAQIKTEKGKFGEQAAKLNIWDKIGDFAQSVATVFAKPISKALGVTNPLYSIVFGSLTDFLIDTFASQQLMGGTKAGDPEAIKKLETAYTGGGFGEEFGKMIEETEVDPWASFIANALEGVGGYATGESLEGMGDWVSKFGGGGGDTMAGIGQGGVFTAPKDYAQGGYVPKYYGGGSVQGGVPTISDYFNRQGKSLGGSNNESLAEMLGRN